MQRSAVGGHLAWKDSMPASMEMSVMPRVTHVPLDASHKPTCSTAASLLIAWQSTLPPAALLPVSWRTQLNGSHRPDCMTWKAPGTSAHSSASCPLTQLGLLCGCGRPLTAAPCVVGRQHLYGAAVMTLMLLTRSLRDPPVAALHLPGKRWRAWPLSRQWDEAPPHSPTWQGLLLPEEWDMAACTAQHCT